MKARVKVTGEFVEVIPYQTEIYDFMVCRSGGIMGELYMRSELTIIGDNELEFVSLVKRMREAQNQWRDGDPFDYTEVELAKRMDETEKEVDEWLEKMK